jgi:hypothetical protein
LSTLSISLTAGKTYFTKNECVLSVLNNVTDGSAEDERLIRFNLLLSTHRICIRDRKSGRAGHNQATDSNVFASQMCNTGMSAVAEEISFV